MRKIPFTQIYLQSPKSRMANWPRVIPFFAYPEEIRKIIYTTNAIESLNNSLKKTIKHRASLPNDEAAVKLLYLFLKNIRKKRTMPAGDWGRALNRFAILYQGSDALLIMQKVHGHNLSDTLLLSAANKKIPNRESPAVCSCRNIPAAVSTRK